MLAYFLIFWNPLLSVCCVFPGELRASYKLWINSQFCSMLLSLDSLWGFFNSMAGNHVYLLPASSTNICLKYWKTHIFQWTWEAKLAKPFTWFRSPCLISRGDSSMTKPKPSEFLWLCTLIQGSSSSHSHCHQGRGSRSEAAKQMEQELWKGASDRP